MTHKPLAVADYKFKPNDAFFLDANIWLFICGPQKPKDKRAEEYSQAFKKMLSAQCRIYIDVLIISEFINTYARMKWKIVAPASGNFKQFRSRADFKPIARNIAADVKYVLSHCSRIESGFEALDIDGLIAEYAQGDSDFNDQVITELCRRKGLTLVTDDGDFRGQGIPVVTANGRLLR